jgi:transposase-like protein
MPKNADFDESRLQEACKAVLAQKRPKIAQIAREFGVSRTTLSTRVKKARSPFTTPESAKNALTAYQEKALTAWIANMRDWNLPPTAKMIEAWANQTLARAGKDRQVGKNWAYRFISRLPEHLCLAPVKQNLKEAKRIQAEDAGALSFWYHQLATLLKDVPARLVYNFDECGFQPGRGQSRRVIGGKSCPDLAEAERG